jgi:tetratricopeptide (TPR) repeat protein
MDRYSPCSFQSSHFISGVLSGLVLAFAFLLAVEKVYNYDIWWHLKTGQWIIETGRIPHTDPFTFTTPAAPWRPHYWLADAFLALILRISSIDWLILLKALIIAIAFLMAFRMMLKQGINPLLAATLVLLAALIAQFRFLLRPHIFMFPLAIAFCWMLSEWEEEHPSRLFWLLPLMLLWVNLHGSFVLGPIFTGSLLVEALLLGMYTRIRFLALFLALLLATFLLNPFGIDLLRRILTDFALKNVTQAIEIEEHRPLAWGEHRLFWGLMLATAASFLPARRRSRLFHLLVFAATSVLAIRGVRFVALAALLHAPILGHNLQGLLHKVPAQRYWPSHRLQAALAIPLLVVGSALALQRTFTESKVYRFGLGVNTSRFPDAAVDFLQWLNPAGNLYNSWKFGGYLLWKWPNRKIFWDGRSLDAQVELAEQVNAMSPAELDALFDRFDIRAALLSPNDQYLAAYFSRSNHFRLTYFDDQALVFLTPQALPPDRLADLGFFELIRPEAYDLSHLAAYARSPMASRAEAELRRAVSLAPQSFKSHFLLGFFLEAGGRGTEALEHYLAAVRANPRLAFAHYDLGRRGGRLALRLQAWDKAIRLLRKASRFKQDAELLFLLGTALYQAGHTEEAEKVYLNVLRREPRQVACLINLGYLYLDTGRFQKAERMQRRALEAAPGNEQALFGLALALQQGGKTEAAVQHWQEFLEKHPQSRWREKAKRYLAQLRRSGS